MSQKKKFLIYSISFLAIGLSLVIIFPMSFTSGIVFVLCLLISVAFLKMKGDRKCQTNTK